MLDDEQQLVVGVGARVLGGEHRVETEVLGVAEVVTQVEVGVVGAGVLVVAAALARHAGFRFNGLVARATPAAPRAATLAGKRRCAAARSRASA